MRVVSEPGATKPRHRYGVPDVDPSLPAEVRAVLADPALVVRVCRSEFGAETAIGLVRAGGIDVLVRDDVAGHEVVAPCQDALAAVGAVLDITRDSRDLALGDEAEEHVTSEQLIHQRRRGPDDTADATPGLRALAFPAAATELTVMRRCGEGTAELTTVRWVEGQDGSLWLTDEQPESWQLRHVTPRGLFLATYPLLGELQ